MLDRSRFTRFCLTLVSIPEKDGSAPVLANLTGLPEGSLPCPIPATNCETLAWFLPQTAKPKLFAAKYA